MSQWARENPELSEEGVTAYDYYAERADQAHQEWVDDEVKSEVTPCPYCGSPLDTPHRASCKLRADGEG